MDFIFLILFDSWPHRFRKIKLHSKIHVISYLWPHRVKVRLYKDPLLLRALPHYIASLHIAGTYLAVHLTIAYRPGTWRHIISAFWLAERILAMEPLSLSGFSFPVRKMAKGLLNDGTVYRDHLMVDHHHICSPIWVQIIVLLVYLHSNHI